MGSILHLQVVPPDGGGDTMFANMYRAYETLSEPIKKMLAGMTAMHEGEHVYRGRYGVNDEGKVFPKAEQPVVRTHPVTGRQALYVNRGFTTRIVGLKRNESAAILEMLTSTSRRRSCPAASNGRQTPSHFGTTGASSIMRCGTTIPTNAMATA
jgi:Probable taurine catabolism dioxygenase